MNSIVIRQGVKEDLPQVLVLVKELAAFERAEGEVVNTVEQMEKDGFGDTAFYGFFVAEDNGSIVGLALYYYRYSTWKGKRLYLEDLIVKESQRGRGTGKKLFDRLLQKSLEDDCTGMMWQVLDWNKPAIEFYEKYGAKLEPEWTNCNLEAAQMKPAMDQAGSENFLK